jgi:hypothetical protein
MPVMLERWNDDEMDALGAKVDGLGESMREQRQETRELRKEMREERKQNRAELLEQRREMKAGFEGIGDRFDRLRRTLLGAAGAIIVALIGAPHL